jgi:hypothetical protein
MGGDANNYIRPTQRILIPYTLNYKYRFMSRNSQLSGLSAGFQLLRETQFELIPLVS